MNASEHQIALVALRQAIERHLPRSLPHAQANNSFQRKAPPLILGIGENQGVGSFCLTRSVRSLMEPPI